jgi:hypothetical protein
VAVTNPKGTIPVLKSTSGLFVVIPVASHAATPEIDQVDGAAGRTLDGLKKSGAVLFAFVVRFGPYFRELTSNRTTIAQHWHEPYFPGVIPALGKDVSWAATSGIGHNAAAAENFKRDH